MFKFFNNKPDQLEGHLSNLMAVALSDGTIDDSEWNRIVLIAKKRGVSEQALNIFRNNIHKARFVPPAEFEEKVIQIFELVEVMMADGVIDPEEVILCRKLAERYNLHPRIINDMITRIPQLIAEGKRTQSIIDEIVDASRFG